MEGFIPNLTLLEKGKEIAFRELVTTGMVPLFTKESSKFIVLVPRKE